MLTPTPRQKVEISKEEVAYWQREIDASIKFQKDEFIDRIEYELLVKYFEGIQKGKQNSVEMMVILDELSPGIASIISSVYYQNPTATVKPARPESSKMVEPPMLYMIQHPEFKPYPLTELMESAIKYGMRKSDMKGEMQLALFHLLVAGFCVIEMNHASENVPAPTPDGSGVPQAGLPPETPEAQGVFDQFKSALKGVFGKKDENLTNDEMEEKIASEQGYQYFEFRDATYCKAWSPLEVLFDSRARVFKESRFIGKVCDKSVGEFNLLYPDFKGKLPNGQTREILYSSTKRDEDKKSVRLYELEIKKKDGVYVLVISKGIEEAIDYYKRPIDTNDFTLKYGCLDKYGRIYPMSRAKKAKKQQDDLNNLATMQMETTLRAVKKVGYFKDGLTDAGKKAMLSSDVFAAVEKAVPSAVFEAVPQGTVTQDNPELQMAIRDTLNKTIGTTELAKSGKSNNDTLGQDELQNQAFETHVSQVQDALQDVATQCLDTLKDIIMQLWDGEDYFQITGMQGGDQWYTPEMGPLSDILQGDFLVSVDIVSAQRPNPARDRNDALQLAQFLTSPGITSFLMANGKKVSTSVIDNVVKSYGQNPEAIIETLPPPPIQNNPIPVQPMGGSPDVGAAPDAEPQMEPGQEETMSLGQGI